MSEPFDFAQRVAGIAALDEPVRRALYLYVSGQSTDVSRDQAAEALGVSRALAAFHLDKLVDEGLLDTRFRRLTGRVGPGAGRPAKLYRRSLHEITVTLPERQYELAARLMAEAIDRAPSPAVRAQLSAAAHQFGHTVGEQAWERAERIADGPEGQLDLLETTLRAQGYEPFRTGTDEVRLRNCPFHALSRSHTSLVCGMNLDLMHGMLDGLHDRTTVATLEPQPGMCCVAFRRNVGPTT